MRRRDCWMTADDQTRHGLVRREREGTPGASAPRRWSVRAGTISARTHRSQRAAPLLSARCISEAVTRRFGESPSTAGGQTPEFECRRRLRPKLGVRPPRGGGGSPWFVLASQSDRRQPRAQPARSPARVGAGGDSGDRAAVSGTYARRSHRTATRGNVCRCLAAVRRVAHDRVSELQRRELQDWVIARPEPQVEPALDKLCVGDWEPSAVSASSPLSSSRAITRDDPFGRPSDRDRAQQRGRWIVRSRCVVGAIFVLLLGACVNDG